MIFLRIGDLASLTFCTGWSDTQTDDSGSGYTVRLEDTRLIVTPDPFQGRSVPIEVPARMADGGEDLIVRGVASGH